jgi:hypothetical protein
MKAVLLYLLIIITFVPAIYADIDIPPISESRWEVPPITERSWDVSSARIDRIPGEITTAGQIKLHPFTAPRDGRYRLELAGLRNARVELYVYNNTGNLLSGTRYDGYGVRSINVENGGGLFYWLNGGQTYQVYIAHSVGFSQYTLVIGHQKETVDISIYTRLNDSVEYTNQRNTYSFTAPRDGRYRFELAGLRNARVELYVYNNTGDLLSGTRYDGYAVRSINVENGGGLFYCLNGGQTYWIYIEQSTGLSPYHLLIGHQKETVDISSVTRLTDSIQYTNQRNVYSFTAPRDGRYRFELAELRNTKVEIYVYNNTGDPLSGTRYDGYAVRSIIVENEGGLTYGLNNGQIYWIYIAQSTGFSPYALNIIGQ